ncbi:DUF4129 domain-containing protein [Paenibacillus pinisoli]|uniref:DUF4129 domain-containing protein n=1 Tax=Paenibacillus pinisoli TaxID=1276110 RepID=A0A3A6PP22_9BACL|nr:DUF4129 domain-containing protein [Paenibacillus pinisoli]RJX37703.1 DUF4129 domain-containing protein [Paenibacillus pinisoli]
MKNNARIPLWRALATGYIELLFYLPILLTLTILLLPAPTMNWWLATLPLAYCVPLAVLSVHTRIRLITRLCLILAAGAAHAAFVALLTGTGLSPIPLVVMSLFGTLFANRGFQQLNLGWSASFHTIHMVVGLAAYIATQILKMVLIQPLSAYTVILNTGILVSIFLLLILMNERHVTNEVVDHRSSQALSATRRQNRIWIVSLMALLGLVMAIAQLRHTIEDWIRSIFRAIFAHFGSGEPMTEEPELPTLPRLILPRLNQKSYRFWDYLEVILYVGFAILMIVVTVYVIKLVYKKFGHAIKAMMDKLLGRRVALAEPDTGFTDEIESLMSFSDLRNRMKNRLRSLFGSGGGKGDEWDSLSTNRDRVRYLYRSWIADAKKRGYEHKPHLTPRETAADQGSLEQPSDREWVHPFIDQYEAVRYGDKEPQDDLVQQFRAKLQTHKRNK